MIVVMGTDRNDFIHVAGDGAQSSPDHTVVAAATDLDDVIRGRAGDDEVHAGGGQDALFGDEGSDVLVGAAGHDALDGGIGDDVLDGGAGADRFVGGAGEDTISYFGSSVAVTVNLAIRTASGGDAQGDSFGADIENLDGGSGNDMLTGSAVANELFGGKGADKLFGEGGDDVLFGGNGADTLGGGAGADRFVYAGVVQSAVGANADRITDFSHVQGDRIDLVAIDASTTVAGNQAFSFIGTGLYTGVAGQLRFAFTSPGVTTIAGDVNGDKVSDFHIVLTGSIVPQSGDFVL
ncbi:Ca2+-binding RTX toxin-like protein [Inquilinus ginsengisoli]|uniref:calcium-binding protein n=1 Tax=Inquilinus ginsengisoli TaxID=363840 RepID=UPI003D24EF60